MKEVKAYIRIEKLNEVVLALAQIDGLAGVSVSKVTGFGRSRGQLRLINFDTHIKVESVCTDEIKDQVVQAILRSARSGERQDGKVFVSTVDEAWRIETGTPCNDAP